MIQNESVNQWYQSIGIEDTLFARMHGCLYCESGFWEKLGGGIVGWVFRKGWGLDNRSEIKACCMFCFFGVSGSFLGGLFCDVACNPRTLCRMATGDIETACLSAERCGCWPMPSACHTLGFGHAQHLHTLRNKRARIQPHRHRTTVLAIVSAQRSCS